MYHFKQMLTEPQAFSVAVQALLSSQKQSIAAQSAAGGEHLVFFGSGREAEDQYVHMVVAFFLQRHVQFVGLVQGGFSAVHQALVAAQIENGVVATSVFIEPVGLVDHNPSLCLVCTVNKSEESLTAAGKSNAQGTPQQHATGSSSSSSNKTDFFGRMRSKSAVVKDKLFDYIVNPISAGDNEPTPKSKSKGAEFHLCASKFTSLSNSFILENPSTGGKSKGAGKLYRNIAPVFSIDDDQDGGIETMLNNYKTSNS
jgi:hypothetical protein